MSHERRYLPEARGRFLEECGTCGKRSYGSRRDARRAARQVPGPVHMNSYRCPASSLEAPIYHIGHLPQSVRSGQVSKSRYLRGAHRVLVQLGEDGMSLLVTFADPKDGARICDALLIAAQLAELDGKTGLQQQYMRLANQTGDALGRAPVPVVNPTPDAPRQETMA